MIPASQQSTLKIKGGRVVSTRPGILPAPARLELRWPCPVEGCSGVFKTKGARTNHCCMVKDPFHVAAIVEMRKTTVANNDKLWKSGTTKGVFSSRTQPAAVSVLPQQQSADAIAALRRKSLMRPRNRGATRRTRYTYLVKYRALDTLRKCHMNYEDAVAVSGIAESNLRRWYLQRTCSCACCCHATRFTSQCWPHAHAFRGDYFQESH